MSNAYNIPSITAGGLIDLLTDLYTQAFHGGMLALVPSVALWGPMGVGKSSAVQQIARRLTENTGREVRVTDIRLLNHTPPELQGLPVKVRDPETGRDTVVWVKPRMFDLDPDCLNIIFLDELSASAPALQAAAYQIVQDKRIGEHILPKDCIVICAGNRTTDRSVAYRMPKALANRLMHFEVRADFGSWYQWAAKQGLDPRVIGYLAFDNSRLDQEPGMEELAFTTPRSWENVSRLLKLTGRTPEEMHTFIAANVGVSTAGEFEAWCRVYNRLPAVEDILSGKYVTPVKGADVTYALITSLLACVNQRSALTAGELDNMCSYAARFPADFAALFFRGLLAVEGMNLKLVHSPSFSAWMKRNKHIL